VHRHWHRGIKRLDDDWKEAKSDYERFILLLTTTRIRYNNNGFKKKATTGIRYNKATTRIRYNKG